MHLTDEQERLLDELIGAARRVGRAEKWHMEGLGNYESVEKAEDAEFEAKKAFLNSLKGAE